MIGGQQTKPYFGVMTNKDADAEELESLRVEHRVLDERIEGILADGIYDDVEIHRLKKRKLRIKDQMIQLESALLPDIIA